MNAETVRIMACQTIPTLINCIKACNNEKKHIIHRNITKVLVKILIKSCELEVNLNPIKTKLECIKLIVLLTDG